MVKRKGNNKESDHIIFQWIFNLDYSKSQPPPVTGPAVAFCLAQTLGRKGSGSLESYLVKRSWVPSSSSNGLLRVSIPVDVSEFQLVRMELGLTTEGVRNRANVVAAVYAAIDALKQRDGTYRVPREVIRQYMMTAKIHASLLAVRPSDAVEMAMDSLQYGTSTVASQNWYLVGDPESIGTTKILQRAVNDALGIMADPENAVILVAAAKQGEESSLPSPSSARWLREPVTGGKFLFENMWRPLRTDELTGPSVNPLVPSTLKSLEGTPIRRVAPDTGNHLPWFKLRATNSVKSSLPEGFSELVIQLVSVRPARANVRMAAHAELWKLSFEERISKWTKIYGLPGGLSYDTSFNKYGMRLSWRGPSRTLPSYVRRLWSAMWDHSTFLDNGPRMLPRQTTAQAIRAAPRFRAQLISNLRATTAVEAAAEGRLFLQSCSSVLVIFTDGGSESQQLPVDDLVVELQKRTPAAAADVSIAAIPSLDDLAYPARWKPRGACSLPGMAVVSDACGRVPR